ncbi:Hypothetical predicted protein [Lecanosticta acicola]|uniref:Uncharacterized protein n=1 Tax=Lecanosticta acicola TaxID=111012 RepID=A0AAI9ECR4_9PEZI|nr:Hypothetical predicted protein [Lecanosticta acicola]
MPAYSYSVAKSVLNEMDKDRFLCLYLFSNHSAIDWQQASRDYGSTSVASFRVLTNRALKKIADAGGKLGENGSCSAAIAPPKERRAKKRKVDISDDTDSDYGPQTKSKRARDAVAKDPLPDASVDSAEGQRGSEECGTPESIGGV